MNEAKHTINKAEVKETYMQKATNYLKNYSSVSDLEFENKITNTKLSNINDKDTRTIALAALFINREEWKLYGNDFTSENPNFNMCCILSELYTEISAEIYEKNNEDSVAYRNLID